MSSVTRLITLGDAPRLTELVLANREFLAPRDLVRDDAYFTAEGQRAAIQDVLLRRSQGTTVPHVILDESTRVVGRITLNGIVRGPLQSCSVGYWVGVEQNGRGLATAAVGDILRVAFDDLGLHRVQAETMLDNIASQMVLERNGFVRFGLAPQYLNIAGRWQDHIMFQKVNDEHRFEN